MTVQYLVRIEDPNTHYAAFEMEFPRGSDRTIDLVLPAWVPGSYKLQNFARSLVDLTAQDAADGRAVPVQRVDKIRWRLAGELPERLRVAYRVYGYQMVTEALDVTSDHLFLNGTVCLPYVEGRKGEPHELRLELPAGWRCVTELPPAGGAPNAFRAPTYDELVDAPVDCGNPRVLTIHPAGIRHRLSFCGPGGNYEAHRVEEDLRRIVEATIRYMGDSPLTGYTFFFHLTEVRDGGLEHLTSNSCVIPRQMFQPLSGHRSFLRLASHEYFHLYNVKRIRPKVLGPFDYTQEVYTNLLWLMEGTTDFVGNLMLRRAGLVSPAKYLETVAGEFQKVYETPGRLHQSLEESSRLAWIDFYFPYEESVNRSVSYYLKGHLVSLCLDLELRDRTQNRAGFQEVLKLLWNEYGRADRGLEEGEFVEVVRRATGESIDEFQRRFIAGTEEVDVDAFARLAGLSFGPAPKKTDPEEDGEAGFLGIDFRVRDGFVRVGSVRDGGPARRAGVSPGDEIVALDGVKVVASEFEQTLKRFPPGSEVELALFRRGWLTKVPVTLGRPPPEKYVFQPLAEATPRQRALYEGWLGAPWEPAKKADPG